METTICILTEQEHAEPFSTVLMYFRASSAFGRAERNEERARSEAKRAYWHAERMHAHAIIVDCRRHFGQRCPEREARVARALAEQQAARLELAPCAA